MTGDPAQTQRQPRGTDVRDTTEWYAVTRDGTSALRIAPGRTIGETAAGELALDDPEPAHQWLSFDVSREGKPSVVVATRQRSLMVDGVTRMRHELNAGATLKLPHNELYVSRDPNPPAVSGLVLEVVERTVPGHPQDLVGPGWHEALRAVQEPSADADPLPGDLEAPAPPSSREVPPPAVPTVAETVLDPDDPDATQVAPHAYDHELDLTVAEPAARPGESAYTPHVASESRSAHRSRRRGASRYERSRRRGGDRLLAATAAVLVVVMVVVLLLRFGWRPGEDSGTTANPPAVATQAAAGVDAADAEPAPRAEPPQDPAQGRSPSSAADEAAASAAERPEPPGRETATAPAPLDATAADQAPAAESPLASRPPGDGVASTPAPTLPKENVGSPGAAELPSSGTAVPSPTQQESTAAATADTPATVSREAAPSTAAEPVEPSGAAPLTGATATAQDPPDWRLIRARELMESGYYTYPPGDNAVAYLERLLEADPGNPGALALLEECASRLIDAAVRAHDQGLEYQARNTLEEVLGFAPEHGEANRLWDQWVSSTR